MRIGWRGLFCGILLRCLAESRERFFWPLKERASEDNSLADIVRKVLRASPTRDVLLIVRDWSADGRTNDILGKISAATARRVPTFYVNAQSQAEPEFQVSPCALSRDLLVYIYVPQREPDIVEDELVADDLRRLVHTHGRAKVLVLMILRQSSLDPAAFFQAIWSRKILNAIVVEYRLPSNERPTTTIHRYDPFADSLTAEPYSANTSEWFTDDFPDMRGYPLVYAYFRRPPYSDVVPTSTAGTCKLVGVDQMVIRTLADKMNFSHVVKVLTHNIYIEIYPNGTTIGIIPDLTAGTYESLFNTLPIIVDANVQFAGNGYVERWCFVVPRLPARYHFFNNRDTVVRLFFASSAIVGIFWLCARLMRLDLARWHPLRIVGIMLSSSYPPAPTRLHERIVFLSIFVACARYSSSLLGELMSLRLESDHHVRFDRLPDLINSHLTLMMFPEMLDIVTEDDAFLESRAQGTDNRLGNISRIDVCLESLLTHQNVSCFMEQGWANLAAVSNMRDGRSMLRITKLCYLSLPTGYIFSRGSPYVGRVSELLLMLSESGIRDKWQRDYLRNRTREMCEEKGRVVSRERTDLTYIDVFWPMLCVLKIGYSLSVLVFVGELLWKRLGVQSRLR